MIPILYSPIERDLRNNGICRLGDCISCKAIETPNGIFECEFKYPITGKYYSEIHEGMIISAIHDDKKKRQAFRIYRRSAPINGIVTFNAHHVSYELDNVIVGLYSADNVVTALSGFNTYAMNENEFSFWTDKSSVGNFEVKKPSSVRSLLWGSEGSILDTFGHGEFEFDNWEVKLHQNRGIDSGVSIRYGKNLIDVVHEVEDDQTYNCIIPYWATEEGDRIVIGDTVVGEATLFTTEYWTNEDNIYIEDGRGNIISFNYAKNKTVAMDFSEYFELEPTPEQVTEAAKDFLTRNRPWIPKENIKVNFVSLWQTDEYAQYAPLQRVSLCDTVTITYSDLGLVGVKSKVVKTVYNVLLERYDEIELGDARTSFAQLLKGDANEVLTRATIKFQNVLAEAIENATRQITGQKGGNIVFRYNAAGKPYELLIMDDENPEYALNVWRWNLSGLGHSHNGINGPYTLGITQDGQIVASMVTSGTLNANLLRAGIIQSYGGENYWDLESGLFQTKRGIIGDFNIYSGYLVYDATGVGTARAIVSKDGISYAYRWGTDDIGSAELYGQGLRIFWNNEEMAALYTVGNGFALTSGFVANQSPGYDILLYTLDERKVYSSENWVIGGSFRVSGTKNRLVETKDYGERLLYSYETTSPYFGDIGEGEVGKDGETTIWIDPILSETMQTSSYQVFLQAYGDGKLYVSKRTPSCFVVKGDAGLSFGWEIKGKQLGYQNRRIDNSNVYDLGIEQDKETKSEGQLEWLKKR